MVCELNQLGKISSNFEYNKFNSVNGNVIYFKNNVAHPFIKTVKQETYNPFDTLKVIRTFNYLQNSYLNPEKLNELLSANPQIKDITAQNKFDAKIDMGNIEPKHLIQTAEMALKIAYIEGMELTPQCYNDIVYSAILHDIGKALIPSEILHKSSNLTYDEKQIIGLHTKLGYELVKNTNLPETVKHTIKNHHNFNDKNPITNLIKIADMYSALTSERAYKEAFSKEKTLEILGENRDNGKICNKDYLALQTALKAG